MKNNFFGKLGILALAMVASCLLLAPAPARAQTYGSISLGNLSQVWTAGSTNIIAGGTTTNQTSVVDCRYNRNLNFTLSCGAVSNATTATYYFLRSPDGVLFDDQACAAFTMVLQMAANSIGTTNINVDVGSVGYLKFQKFVTGATYGTTNARAIVSLKPGN
jgi:hypothetical protein